MREYPELYDYYIRLRETDVDKIRSQSLAELNEQIEKLCVASQKIISLFKNLNYQTNEQLTAREEAKARLRFFKHIIEDCDGYKNLYTDGKQIAKENDLQRLFRFVWYGTSYKVDAEPNNGRGQADFIVSMGQNNQNIVEFKLASNSTLSHVFTQVKIYEAANCTDGSLIAIFCFSESEYLYSEQVVKAAGYEELLGESIYLIDCRNDNKKSASIHAHHQRYAERRGREDRRLHGIRHGSHHPGASRPTGGKPVQGDTVREGGIIYNAHHRLLKGGRWCAYTISFAIF